MTAGAPPVTCRVEFWVPGIPAPQGSKSFKGFAGNGRAILVESSKRVKPWRECVSVMARKAMSDAGNSGPFTGPVILRSDFILPRPKSAPKLKVLPATKRPDADKILRAVGDALSGICYVDDAQVVDIRGTKRVALFGEEPGCQITVTEGP